MNKQNLAIDIISTGISLLAISTILLIFVFQPLEDNFLNKSCMIDQLIIYLNHNSN